MEEFRAPIVDSMVMNLLIRKMINNSDFDIAENKAEKQICILKGNARKIFIRSFEAKMNKHMRHPATGFNVDYRRCIDLQVQKLRRIIEGSDETYKPFLIK